MNTHVLYGLMHPTFLCMFKAQGFMAGLQAGGSLVGIVVGGVVYEYCGGRTLFRSMAVIMVSFQLYIEGELLDKLL